MDIKQLLEEFDKFEGCPECGCKEGQCTCDKDCKCEKEKDESLNEEKDLASEPAKMEKDEYKTIKTIEPEVDGDSTVKKLLKRYEALEVKADSMEDETGMNEIPEEDKKNENFKDVKIIKDKYKNMKIVEPETDGDTEAKKFLKKNEEAITEISKSTAEENNDLRHLDYAKKMIKAKQTEDPEDEAAADEARQKADKSDKLLKKWKKSKGYDESLNEEVVVKFDEGKHEIVHCKNGYYNRYNIKEGKAGFTTKCVKKLPTAVSALKRRFPQAEQDK